MMLNYPDMPNLTFPSIREVHGKLNHAISQREIADISGSYFDTWEDTANRISVPHFMAFAEFDQLWVINEEVVEEFRNAFLRCPRTEAGIWPGAPHDIELNVQGQNFLKRKFEFAVECAEAHAARTKHCRQ